MNNLKLQMHKKRSEAHTQYTHTHSITHFRNQRELNILERL